MARPTKSSRAHGGLTRSAATALVCASLATAAYAQPYSAKSHPAKPKKHEQPLSRQGRVQHALNRFTFGPVPGQQAAVTREGLDAWFNQQLHPERIPDAELDDRLARFPAMQLTQAELIERFPSPELLRQYSRGALDAPADPVERAIYTDAAFQYREKREAKTQKQHSAANASAGSRVPETGMDAERAPAPAAVAGAPPTTPGGAAEAATAADRRWDDSSVQAFLALPPEQRFRQLAQLSPDDVQALRQAMKGPEQQRIFQGLTPVQMEQVTAMQAPERVVASEVMGTRLLRDVYSERQLQAVMTDFWLNHFNVYLRKNQNEPYLLSAYEREAILPHALGRFEDLLVAAAESPAMLIYLDNVASLGPSSRAALRNAAAQRPGAPAANTAGQVPKGINENYARELMELHTLGVNGGYTQQDVIEVAKCFTGWTIESPARGGGFTFNPNRHEPGPKTVLGHLIPESGEDEGLAVLHILATSPATAHLLSLQLAQRFVSDNPPPALVDRMAKTYLKTDGDISKVLLTLFHSPEFWSPDAYRAKVKTPIEFVASALRASGAEVVNPQPLVQAMDRLGMPIYGMQTPNGYAWTADAWVSSSALLARMNFALLLSANRLPGTHIDWQNRLGIALAEPVTPDEATEARLETALLGSPAAPQTRAAVLEGVADPALLQNAAQNFGTRPNGGALYPARAAVRPSQRPGNPAQNPIGIMAGLLVGSPDFQRR